ncbi:MAG: sulfatase-like hydrolase/transferase [Pseudomonadota bacterium]
MGQRGTVYLSCFLIGIVSFLFIEAIFSWLIPDLGSIGWTAYLIDGTTLSLIGIALLTLMPNNRLSPMIAGAFPAAIAFILNRYQLMFDEPFSGYDLDWQLFVHTLDYLSVSELLFAAAGLGLIGFTIHYSLKTVTLTLLYSVLAISAFSGHAAMYEPKKTIESDAVSAIGHTGYLWMTLVERQLKNKELKKVTTEHWETHHEQIQSVVNRSIDAHRNIYLVVLESWVDFRNLNVPAPEALMAPSYRAKVADHINTASAPIAGGRTVNSEFEILCGVPSMQKLTRLDFFMLERMDNPRCALPLLKDVGYRTQVVHAGNPLSFNAGAIYKAAGLTRQRFLDVGETNPVDDPVTDRTLFQEALQSPKEQPTLTYMMGAFGHHPFMNDPEEFPVPEMIDALELDATSERLLTQEYYRQRWIAEFLDEVRKEDPDALVVITGDHTPPDESGKLLANEREVPFLVMDQGHLVTLDHTIPLFNTHQLIFDRLSDGHFCETLECQEERDRDSQALMKRYLSFAASMQRLN